MTPKRTRNMKRTLPRILVTLAMAGVTAIAGLFVGKLIPDQLFENITWEDVLTTSVGVWMLLCVPITILRWVAVPAARYGNMLLSPLASLVVGGLSLVLPVFTAGVIDPTLVFAVLVILFAASAAIQIYVTRTSDELARRYMADSTLISSSILIAAFSLYAAGERLAVIGTISPWGLVGIACLVQFAVSMYVYYKLGMSPEAQEKAG